MGVRQELESLGLHIKADRTILKLAVSQKPKGPLSFMEQHYPIRLGSIITATTTYFFERLVEGSSPEEIITRSRSLIRIFSKPV